MTHDGVVEVSMYIAVQPGTDPGCYAHWMGNNATLEPVPGGCHGILTRDGVEAVGESSRSTRRNRLALSGWPHVTVYWTEAA
jgi:hypothetical protein